MFYLAHSFVDPLPWTNCNNSWNTENCFSDADNNNNITETSIDIEISSNVTQERGVSSSQEFYEWVKNI